MKRILLLSVAAVALAACGEKPQTLGGTRQDAAPYNGTSNGFSAPGWKQGDKASWEQHLKARQQNSQNDYSRMN